MEKAIWLVLALLSFSAVILSLSKDAQAAPFTNNGNGTVTDQRTGLMWQQGEPGAMLWGAALNYCEGLTLPSGGYSDWRLPNIKELESLTDDSRYNPAIDTNYFPNANSYHYWSSTTHANEPNGAWSVGFNAGQAYFNLYRKGDSLYVRCVRGGQSGSSDYLDHFTITDLNNNPIGNQTVNSPFSIKTIAKDANGNTVTSFNGWITLSSNAGNVSPSSLYIVNGSWGGNVTIFEDSSNLRLIASGSGVQGVSNSFSTTGQIASVGRIEGSVKDNRNNPLSGATVRLSYTENGADAYPSVQTDSLGNYHFDNITSGNYYIWTEYNGNSSDKKTNKFFAGWGTATWKLTIDLYQSTDIPVILVPGVMGSTHYTMAGKWANHPYLTKAYEDGDNLILHDPTQGLVWPFNFSPGWLTLKEKLTAKGLEDNKNIIECPWDWRVPLEQAVGKYLKPCIEKAQDGDPTKPVNIIAHSMGGLLVREYIQGYSYNNEILNFSMVGTPNEGAPKAYYVWEGGDPEEVDDFYWETTKILYEDTYQLGSLYSMEHGKIRDFIHDYVPTVRQLLPTYDFLDYKGTLKSITSADNANDFLVGLNSNNNRYALMGMPSSTGKVKTRIYYSISESTINDIDILMNSDSFWTSFLELYGDGRPQKNTIGLGDETVPRSSAKLPCDEGWAECKCVTGKHAELIRVNADEITNDLYPSQVSALGIRSSAMAIASDATTPLSNVSLSFQGRIQPYITDPQGRNLGVNASNGAVEKAIPDSEVNIDSNSGSLSIDNPVDGVYTVSLRGVYNEDYNFNIGYMDASGGKEIKYHGFNHANTTSFTFTVNSSAVDKITVNRTPLPPTGLQADAVNSSGLKTRLTWTANTDAGVTGYNVYAKYIDEPYLTQIGTSVTNSFDTGDAWAENGSVVTSIYAVSAKKADGTESFLSNMVENNDRDHDGLTDAQETSLGTNLSNADSDGDGLKDGEEYIRGTNPLVKDTDGDGYNDNAEVINGSDPLDPESTPVPAASAGLSVKAIASDSIVLAWKDTSYNEKGFKIERKEGACDSTNTWTQIAVKGTNIATHTNAGLTANTTYSYQVKAYNTGFSSAYSNCVSTTTGKAGTPDAPTGLTATSASANQVNLKWTDKSTDETKFRIYRKTGTGSWTPLATTTAGVTTYSDPGAAGNDAANSYSYYVQACNTYGCSPATRTAVVPFRPSDLIATINSGIKLTWTDNSANETGFQIYRKAGTCSSTNTWGLISTTAANGETFTDTGMAAGQYSYHVRAYFKSAGQPFASGYSMFTGCVSATAP